MMDFEFTMITEDNILPEDLDLFLACAEASDGADFVDPLWQRLCEGSLIGWKWSGPKGSGMLLAEIRIGYTRKQLHIFAVAGKGYLRCLPQMFEILKEFGREHECTVMTGDTKRPGLQRAYEHFGGVESFRQYEISLTHS